MAASVPYSNLLENLATCQQTIFDCIILLSQLTKFIWKWLILVNLFDEKFSEFLLPVMSDFIKRNEKRAT